MRAPVVVSLGGSFLVGENGVNTELARALADILERIAKAEGRPAIAVIGGGMTARTYIRAARQLGADEATLDDLGIAVTRINARVLLAALKDPAPRVPESLDDAIILARGFPVVAMGGTHPGHTTDAVAAFIAEKTHAKRLVIATNVDGVYESDPKKNPDAKRLPRLTGDELVAITSGGRMEAGSAGVVDPMASKIIARSGVECAIVDGRDLKNLEAALLGSPDFHGSLVTPERG